MERKDIPGPVFNLATTHLKSEQVSFEKLPQSGSQRLYFRAAEGDNVVMAAYNENIVENKAFINYLRHFLKKGLPVPELYAVNESLTSWLMEDLGDESLFSLIPEGGLQPEHEEVIELYKKALTGLVRFQTEGHEGLDYSVAYPRGKFDEKAIRWDLNYFKYYFLHVSGLDYNESQLEEGFDRLVALVLSIDNHYFMYRDFQARNIMITDGRPRFIDFQGGRQGPPHYDVVSLLYQSRAIIHPLVRESLLKHYIRELSAVRDIREQPFRDELEFFKLIRTLQVLGAYGYRGYIQQRAHFLKSVPYAMNNLRELLSGTRLPESLTPLTEILSDLIKHHTADDRKRADTLTVTLNSFSFLQAGQPTDTTGNGGGFVFDCRGLPNPGRFMEYSYLTGQDEPVIRFLQERNEVSRFIENIFRVVSQTIDNYIERGFEHLMINFGCTGGQHRSVYCAEQLFKKLKEHYDMDIRIRHYQQERNKEQQDE